MTDEEKKHLEALTRGLPEDMKALVERGLEVRKIRRFVVTVNKGPKPGIGLAVVGDHTDEWVKKTPAVDEALKAAFREVSASPPRLRYTRDGAIYVSGCVRRALEAAFPEEKFSVTVEG